MRWISTRPLILALSWLLSCALAGGDEGTTRSPALAETAGDPNFAEGLLAPDPIGALQGPTVIDPPVPYYSQTFPFDDPTMFDPRLELPDSEVKLGWNLLLEVDCVRPFLHNGLNSGNLLAGSLPEAVSVPSARPNWTAMPRIDLAYRFDSGYGEVHAIFRTLNTTGTGTIANFDAAGAGTLASHLNLNVLDVDYAYTEFNPGRIPIINPILLIPARWGLNLRPEEDPYPVVRMKWAFGGRVANVFFDSRGAGQQILQERVTNNFTGAGVHTSVDMAKPFWRHPALGVYARFEFSGLFGDVTQSFARTETLAGGGVASGAGRVRDIHTGVPIVEAELGLSYTPTWGPCWLRFTSGYRYEQWWYLGQSSNSSAGIDFQGVFFRGEWGY